jgi:hypothetical protein
MFFFFSWHTCLALFVTCVRFPSLAWTPRYCAVETMPTTPTAVLLDPCGHAVVSFAGDRVFPDHARARTARQCCLRCACILGLWASVFPVCIPHPELACSFCRIAGSEAKGTFPRAFPQTFFSLGMLCMTPMCIWNRYGPFACEHVGAALTTLTIADGRAQRQVDASACVLVGMLRECVYVGLSLSSDGVEMHRVLLYSSTQTYDCKFMSCWRKY